MPHGRGTGIGGHSGPHPPFNPSERPWSQTVGRTTRGVCVREARGILAAHDQVHHSAACRGRLDLPMSGMLRPTGPTNAAALSTGRLGPFRAAHQSHKLTP